MAADIRVSRKQRSMMMMTSALFSIKVQQAPTYFSDVLTMTPGNSGS
jgi:hypothetical protein